MTDGQLRVFALVLVLIALEVWLHWAAVYPFVHSIVKAGGGGGNPFAYGTQAPGFQA